MIEILFKEDTELQLELDSFLIRQSEFSPYQLSAWRMAVQEAYGFTAGVITYREDGQLLGFLPFNQVRDPFGRSQIVSLPFCDMGAAIALHDAVREKLEKALVQAGTTATRGCELRQGALPMTDGEQLAGHKVTMQLALPSSSSELLASYVPKLRSQIKKAEKNGLTVEITTEPTLVRDFYAVYAANMHRLGSPPHSLNWFERIAASYHAADGLLLCVVKYADKVVGAGFVLRAGNRAVIPWASTLADFNHLAPNMLLYWSIQSWLADHEINHFDFGRSTYGEGTYRFKKQWGAEPVPLKWTKYTNAGELIVAATATTPSKLRPMLESLWRKLPEPLMTGLGSKLRRYITL